MRKLVVSEFISLDGVIEAPHEWHFAFWHDEMGEYKQEELFASDAMLLGRVTYDGFAAAWPTMEDTGEFGERMNGMAKYVVSKTLTEPTWQNTTVLRDDPVGAIRRLKAEPGQNILVGGSADLVNLLVAEGLVDELRLMIHPVVVGHGKRLFQDGVDTRSFQLSDTRTFPSGVVVLTYGRAGAEGEASQAVS